MKTKLDSRGPQIDNDRCVEAVGNRYMLVIAASQRLREMRLKNKDPDRLITTVDVLQEFQEVGSLVKT